MTHSLVVMVSGPEEDGESMVAMFAGTPDPLAGGRLLAVGGRIAS